MTEKITLPSGVRIVLESMPQLRSVSVGLWVSAGSAFETPAQSGMSHFLEHLLFKGTEKRTALEISATMEGVGGVLNAFTGREHTCYYTRSMDEHFQLSLELLADLFTNSKLCLLYTSRCVEETGSDQGYAGPTAVSQRTAGRNRALERCLQGHPGSEGGPECGLYLLHDRGLR